MKKIWKSPKYKKYNNKRALRALEDRLEFKLYKRDENRRKKGIGSRSRQSNREPDTFTTVTAPTDFSLINNSELVISFINKLRKCFHRKESVFIQIKHVKNI